MHKDSSNPLFIIENIGHTVPNPDFGLSREGHAIFVVEYIIKGREFLNVDGKDYVLEPGDVCILEPRIPHSYYSDPEAPVEKKWINFQSDVFEKTYEDFGFKGQIVFKNINTYSAFDELLLIADNSNYSEDVCYDVASVLFKLLCSIKKQTSSIEEKCPNENIEKVKKYLDNNIFKKVNLDEIAQMFFYCKKQITRDFKKYYNNTPYNYFIELKINTAKKLLEVTQLSVKEISSHLSFENQHHFSKAFKNKVGVSPSEYRESHHLIKILGRSSSQING